jgi:hypothetical protein
VRERVGHTRTCPEGLDSESGCFQGERPILNAVWRRWVFQISVHLRLLLRVKQMSLRETNCPLCDFQRWWPSQQVLHGQVAPMYVLSHALQYAQYDKHISAVRLPESTRMKMKRTVSKRLRSLRTVRFHHRVHHHAALQCAATHEAQTQLEQTPYLLFPNSKQELDNVGK